MPAPVADIDAALRAAPNYIALISYGEGGPPTLSLLTQFNLWITGMFPDGGIFEPGGPSGERVVTNWYAQHIIARSQIEGAGVGDASVVGTSAVIDAVVRVLWAVKFGAINTDITVAQRAAVVALFNTVWA